MCFEQYTIIFERRKQMTKERNELMATRIIVNGFPYDYILAK